MRRAGGGTQGGRDTRPSRFERSARFWLHAYPRRWRRDRGDEVVGVLLELAGVRAGSAADSAATAATAATADPAAPAAPAAPNRGIGPRAALDLVRHGWATRLREHPPLLRWLGYRFLDVGLPVRYRDWIADDIDGALYVPRTAALACLFFAVVTANNVRFHAFSPPFLLLPAAVLGISFLPAMRARRRRLARERHLVLAPGEPLVHGAYVAMGGPHRRVPAAWAVPRAFALDLTALVSALVAPAVAPTAFVARAAADGTEIDVGAPGVLRWVYIGVLLAILAASYAWNGRARAGLASRVADLPAQPDRVVVRPGRGQDVALGIGLVLIVAWAAGEASGQWALSLSQVAGACGAAHLPRTLAVAVAARRAGHRAPDGSALTWADLDKVAATRRPPHPDIPVRVVRRWDGPTVPGQAVLSPRPYPPGGDGSHDPYRLA